MEIRPIYYAVPDFAKIIDGETFFSKLKESYPQYHKKAFFIPQEDPGLIVYRICTVDRNYHGILAGVNIEEYLTGSIKKHENTLITQEELMIALTLEREAIIKPVLITYSPVVEIHQLIHQTIREDQLIYRFHFTKGQQTHEFYRISDSTIEKRLTGLFAEKVSSAYIADGHHRMAAMSDVLEARPKLVERGLNFILSAWFDFDELSIMSYNRIVDVGQDLFQMDLLNKLQAYGSFDLTENISSPVSKFELLIVLGKQIYQFRWHPEHIRNIAEKNQLAFDVDLFNDLILKECLGIHDVRRDPRIKYVEGVKGLRSVLKHTEQSNQLVGFMFYPIHHDEFKKTADHARILPPKSTWFEPRIRNGMIVQEFRRQEK
ncbi:MAG: DUF1015 domain-containing protein [Saprospiraceae bacterium]|nr:DUF1015 domain-containing protein [Saprospiraceae bacterium]